MLKLLSVSSLLLSEKIFHFCPSKMVALFGIFSHQDVVPFVDHLRITYLCNFFYTDEWTSLKNIKKGLCSERVVWNEARGESCASVLKSDFYSREPQSVSVGERLFSRQLLASCMNNTISLLTTHMAKLVQLPHKR